MFRDAFIDEMAKIGIRLMSGGQQIRVAPQMRHLDPRYRKDVQGRTYGLARSSSGRTDALRGALRDARIKNVERAYQRQQGEPGRVVLPRFGGAPKAVVARRAAAAVPAPKIIASQANPAVGRAKAPEAEAPRSRPGFFARVKAKLSKEKGEYNPFGPLSVKAERGVQEAQEARRRQVLGSRYSPPAHVPSSSPPSWAKMSESDVERKLSKGKKPAIIGGVSTVSSGASKPAKKGILSHAGGLLTRGVKGLGDLLIPDDSVKDSKAVAKLKAGSIAQPKAPRGMSPSQPVKVLARS